MPVFGTFAKVRLDVLRRVHEVHVYKLSDAAVDFGVERITIRDGVGPCAQLHVALIREPHHRCEFAS